jgi:hypothetical protein
LNIAVAVAVSLLFLGLLLLKVVLSASTILVFVGMPLAAVVWPVVPWVARAAMRAFAVCLLVPVLWALCFAAGGAAMLNAISFNAPSVLNSLLQPLVAIVLLYVMLKLPVHLARVAMLGAAPLGGGFVSRAVSYAAGSQVRDAARQHLPSWAGGQQAPRQQPQQESRTGTRLRNAATLAAAAATGGAATGGAAATAAATAAAAGGGGSAAASGTTATGAGTATGTSGGAVNGRAYAPPPTAQAHAAGALQNGLQTPSFAGREQDFANEKFEAEFRGRTSPVSGEQARAALASLPKDTQRGIGQLVSEHGAGAREHLAYQAMGEWSPAEREALRTLAAATPDVRAHAVNEVAGDVSSDVDHDDGGGATAPGTRDLGATGGAAGSAPREPWSGDDSVAWAGGSAGDPGTRSRPSAPPSPPAAGEPGSAGPAPVAAPARRSLPAPPARRSLPPPREPRGPSPDELFPNG